MPSTDTLHEDLRRQNEVRSSSDRAFGIVFAVVFAVIAAFPLLDGGVVRGWALGVAGAFLAVALVRPGVLAPLNRLWLLVGALLHRIVSPIVLGLLYFVIVVPTGIVMRLVGARTVPVAFEPERDSYWIVRDPPGPAPDGMKNQF